MSKNSDEWQKYIDDLPERGGGGMGLQTDITSFFASISPSRLKPMVFGALGRVAAANLVMDVVQAHDDLFTRSGLPQRSYASSILANAFVRPIDDVITAALADARIMSARRWMDDISAEGAEEVLYPLLIKMSESARHIGLELNASKTRLVPVDVTSEHLHLEDLREIEVPTRLLRSHYDEAVEVDLDTSALLSLEEQCLMNPHSAPRPLLKAVLVSLAEYGEFDHFDQWLQRAAYIPHAADSLGRYLRAAGRHDPERWDEMSAWFALFEASPWSTLDWVSSQIALAFPSADLRPAVVSVLRDWLTSSNSLQKVSIATERLALSDPTLCRSLVRSRVDHTDDPQLVRVFALGLLTAGETDAVARSVLSRGSHNRLLIRWLDRGGWRIPPVASDFDG